MAHRDVVVIGASAGGVEALQRLLGGLSPDLPVAVFVVLHMPPTNVASLPPFSPGQLRSPWSTPVMERRS